LTEDLFRKPSDSVFLDTIALDGLAAAIIAVVAFGNTEAIAAGAIVAGLVYEAIAVVHNAPELAFEDIEKVFHELIPTCAFQRITSSILVQDCAYLHQQRQRYPQCGKPEFDSG